MPFSTHKTLHQAVNLPRAKRETAVTMMAGFLLLLGVYSSFLAQLYRNYLLILDDPANISGTIKGGLRGWLTGGMAGYYHVYPEWPQPGFSNFYRPVWNLIIFGERAIFGTHYWLWFLAFCALQYLGALLILRVQRSMGVPLLSSLIMNILFLFNPAFLGFGFIYPGFQFDVFASLFLLLAFQKLINLRFGWSLVLISAAVFTKETAIFAPLAAAITVFILKRDGRWSLAMLAPLLVWIAARWLAYHAVLGGTFASPANICEVISNIGRA